MSGDPLHTSLYLGLQCLFWMPVILLVHTYIIYPKLMRWLAKGKSPNDRIYGRQEHFPHVTILMAAYNEEAVIRDKLESLIGLDYPADKIKIFIGSDNSTDATNGILSDYSTKYPAIHYIPFTSRQGKPSIINQMASMAKAEWSTVQEHLFLMTDASVMLDPMALHHLAKHFANPTIGLVDANMQYTGLKAMGISKSENQYLGSEVRLKHNESLVWGAMIGPFGGCFAMRSELYIKVPTNFLVDDFYIAMHVLSEGYQVINDLDAIAEEQVSHKITEEYRRKKRISIGNFQNLFRFRHMLKPTTSLGFAFISHKVLRWVGPFLMLCMVGSSLGLALGGSRVYSLLLLGLGVWFIVIPLLDKLLKLCGWHFMPFRSVAYFNLMNGALLMGFFTFLGGVQSSIWEPTEREV